MLAFKMIPLLYLSGVLGSCRRELPDPILERSLVKD